MDSLSLNLKKDSVNKIFWSFAIPSVLAILAQSTAGFIDSIFIGRYIGSDGLSALTLIMPLIMLLSGVGTMLSIGGSTLAGIYKGEGKDRKSNHYFMLTFSLLIISTLIATIFILLGADFFGKLLGAEGIILEHLLNYSKTLAVFFICFMMNFALSFFIKLDGKPSLVVTSVLSGTVINIVLDYIFIKHLNMGMFGAALATGLSQLIPFTIMLYILIYKTSWKFQKPSFNIKDIWAISFNGSSELLSMGAASISGFIFNYLIIKHIGFQGVAAFSVSLQVVSVATGIFYGFSEAIQSPVSYNVGAREFNRVRSFRKKSLYANLISGILLIIIIFLLNEKIVAIFISDHSVGDLASSILKIYSTAFILYGVNTSHVTYFTAINSPVISSVLSLIKSLFALLLGMFILPLFIGSWGIFYSVLFAEIVTFIVSFIIIRTYEYGSYDTKKILEPARL